MLRIQGGWHGWKAISTYFNPPWFLLDNRRIRGGCNRLPSVALLPFLRMNEDLDQWLCVPFFRMVGLYRAFRYLLNQVHKQIKCQIYWRPIGIVFNLLIFQYSLNLDHRWTHKHLIRRLPIPRNRCNSLGQGKFEIFTRPKNLWIGLRQEIIGHAGIGRVFSGHGFRVRDSGFTENLKQGNGKRWTCERLRFGKHLKAKTCRADRMCF